LKASPEILSNRIKNSDVRPLLNGADDLIQLSNIWQERKEFYEESADVIIQTDRLNPAQVLDLIIKKLEEKNAND